MDIPYVIVKGKARLGKLLHKKQASSVAIVEVNKDDSARLQQVVENAKAQFNDNVLASRPKWGGGILGAKAQAVVRKREKAFAREQQKKIDVTNLHFDCQNCLNCNSVRFLHNRIQIFPQE